MIKKALKFFTIVFFLTGSLTFCSKNGNNDERIEEDFLKEKKYLEDSLMIIGQWKLINASIGDCLPLPDMPVVHLPKLIDFSQYNITYEFRTNGVVAILCSTEDFHKYYYLPQEGGYPFFFSSEGTGQIHGFSAYELIISGQPFWYNISSEVLILDLMMSSNTSYTFVKIY